MNFKYNADKESYSSDTYLGYSCNSTYSKYVTCFVGKLEDNYESYVGSNAYGASRKVTKTSGIDFALAIDSENSIYKSLFTTKSQYDDSKILTLELPVKLEKAKEIKDKKIAVIFVGTIADAKKIDGKRVYYSATIDWPRAMDIETVAAPFNLENIIIYVYETGEILANIH